MNKQILLLSISTLSVLMVILDLADIISTSKNIRICAYIIIGILPVISLKNNNKKD